MGVVFDANNDRSMSLSPSRVESFLSCPLAYKFVNIDNLPEAPTPHTTKGSLVHRALELLFGVPRDERTRAAGADALATAVDEYRVDPEFVALRLTSDEADRFIADAGTLVDSYFDMEDPREVREVGVEMKMATTIGDLTLRGIIDRLEEHPDGGLVVVDYKTGRAPGPKYESDRLNGVHFYAFLCQEVLGQRPVAVRLMYLRSRDIITATPTAQSVKFLATRTTAVWNAVRAATAADNFQPKTGPLCKTCSFRDWCPAFGGDPARAAVEAPLRYGAPS